MKRIVEINYGTSITINRGNYENEKPMWHQKTTLELENMPDELVEATEKAEFCRLKARLDQWAYEEFKKSKQELLGLKIRIKDGKKYPSVNSILHPEPLKINPEYALRGTEIHNLVTQFIKTGQWAKPKTVLSELTYEEIPYEAFFCENKNFELKTTNLNMEVYNERLKYSGELDAIGSVDGAETLIDFKTGQWDWKQLVAYNECFQKPFAQLAIFDLKKNKIELLQRTDPKYQNAWEAFLLKRGEFKARFGL